MYTNVKQFGFDGNQTHDLNPRPLDQRSLPLDHRGTYLNSTSRHTHITSFTRALCSALSTTDVLFKPYSQLAGLQCYLKVDLDHHDLKYSQNKIVSRLCHGKT
ncbi:hypothetical protein ACKWTF_008437 [Chironomus riparius]